MCWLIIPISISPDLPPEGLGTVLAPTGPFFLDSAPRTPALAHPRTSAVWTNVPAQPVTTFDNAIVLFHSIGIGAPGGWRVPASAAAPAEFRQREKLPAGENVDGPGLGCAAGAGHL